MYAVVDRFVSEFIRGASTDSFASKTFNFNIELLFLSALALEAANPLYSSSYFIGARLKRLPISPRKANIFNFVCDFAFLGPRLKRVPF